MYNPYRYHVGYNDLEPWDCWHDESSEPDEEDYDREEDEMNGLCRRTRFD